MTRILSIETSTLAASVAVTEDGKLIGEEYTSYKLKHSEKLLPLVEHLLEDVRLEMSDIDMFAAGTGPGSFTGLRIAASTVKAFAHVTGKDIIAVSSLDALAEANRGRGSLICAMNDAQRNDVYSSLYDSSLGYRGKLSPEDTITDSDELLDSLKGRGKVLFAGDGVHKNRKKITEILGADGEIASDALILPRASAIGVIAHEKLEENRDIFTYDNFLPNYIRPSAAEEQRRKRRML